MLAQLIEADLALLAFVAITGRVMWLARRNRRRYNALLDDRKARVAEDICWMLFRQASYEAAQAITFAREDAAASIVYDRESRTLRAVTS